MRFRNVEFRWSKYNNKYELFKNKENLERLFRK